MFYILKKCRAQILNSSANIALLCKELRLQPSKPFLLIVGPSIHPSYFNQLGSKDIKSYKDH